LFSYFFFFYGKKSLLTHLMDARVLRWQVATLARRSATNVGATQRHQRGDLPVQYSSIRQVSQNSPTKKKNVPLTSVLTYLAFLRNDQCVKRDLYKTKETYAK